jgi:membrane protein implicated in regulation of membrane protease activity
MSETGGDKNTVISDGNVIRMELIEWIERVDALTWLCVGLLLVLADVFVSSYYLLFVGLAIATNTLWDGLGLGAEWQMAITSVALISFAIAARRIVVNRGPSLLEQHTEELEGLRGRVIWVDPETPRRGRGALSERGEWLIETLGPPLCTGAAFVVVAIEGATLKVVSSDEEHKEAENLQRTDT